MNLADITSKAGAPKQLRLSIVIFFTCLLFTTLLWDRYFNSEAVIDRVWVSNIILVMGALFSVSAATFAWLLESGKSLLEKQVEKRTHELKERNLELETALSEIKTLRGFIPICATCKKIRDVKGLWHQMEAYIQNHSDAKFSHGLCQTCLKEMRAQMARAKNRAKAA